MTQATLRVEVVDSGIGIEPALLSRIFNAFEQVGEGERFGRFGTWSGDHEGTRRNAWRRRKCDKFGAGPRCKVHRDLPDRRMSVQFDQPTHRTMAKPTTSIRLRLLLVEDHEDTSRSLSRLLVRRGYEVRAARTLETALETAREFEFDVLISDMGLPDGSGIELMEQLLGRAKVRGIALSGYGMEEDVQRSMGVGYREHLTKPVDIGRLDAAIQRIGRES